jgi:GNAT superfamily N-acetyltransferase
MAAASERLPDIECHPVTPDRWQDLETLFGPRGGTGGCWCMWWRVTRAQFNTHKGEGNKRAFQRLIEGGEVPGLLAYLDGQAVAWCAVAPRERYPVLERSRILTRVDDQPVWSVVCFFVKRPFRGRGLTTALLRAAVAYARRQGAHIIEGYPVEPKTAHTADVFAYTGLVSSFRRAGFVEVQRRSETRPIMRYVVSGSNSLSAC